MPAARSSESAFFATLSQDLVGHGEDPEHTVQRMVDQAVKTIGPVSWAGVTLRRRRNKFESVATTDPLVQELDELQYELREGPCLDAATGDGYQLATDLSDESRWPQWSPRAAERGIGSVLAVQLVAHDEDQPLGALNLYGAAQDEWTGEDLDLSLVFSVHAANALASTQKIEGLRTALGSRHDIGVAQGILMARYDLTVDQSFDALRRLSSTYNLRVSAVAEEIVQSGGLVLERLASASAAAEEHRDTDGEPAPVQD